MTVITSVIPTGARPGFLRQAVRYWQRQSLPVTERELIVVDDNDDPAVNAASCEGVPGVRHIHLDAPTPQGTKLNIGFAAARGDVFHKWDDDDIYRPGFLAAALEGLAAAPTPLAIWDCYLVYLAWNGELRSSGHGHKAGPGIVFGRAAWERVPFRDIGYAVDSWFVNDHGRPDSVTPICGHETELIYVRHKSNTWQQFWQTDVDGYIEAELDLWHEPFEALMPDPQDRAFYEALRAELTTR